MNDFDSEDRPRDRGNRDRREGGPRRRGGGGGDVEFGYKENGQGFRGRRPPRGMGNFGRNEGRPFHNPRGFAAPQFRQYDNPGYPIFEGRGRGWGRGQRYPRGGGGGGGGYMRYRNPQDNYYNDGQFQDVNRPPPDAEVGYAPDQDRRRRRPNGGMRRYENNNENENIGYERKRYGDNAIGGGYRRGGRGRGQMRNNNNNNNNGYGRGSYNNRGGQGGHRTNRRYPFNSGRRGQRRNQRGGHQRAGQFEEKKVPFLIETVQYQPVSDVKSDVEDNQKEKQETTIPNSGQFGLHYWDAPTIENLPPLK